eukprot:m.395902 g.395902  ORF g.395902 m.395902 type:complete len:486 (-) comp56402_c0_seq3:19-1476(-)
MALLETSIRATNAQYDSAEILSRLDVRLLQGFSGDSGWDVFSLNYRVDGPIKIVFSSEVIHQYLRIFNFLWRTKRIEYCLSTVWSAQTTHARGLTRLRCMDGILHRCRLISAEMTHFINQIEYYLVFEVLECSWTELKADVENAKDIDCVIDAHSKFLKAITQHALLSPDSQNMLSQLRSIYDAIIRFQGIQEDLYRSGAEELDRQNRDRAASHKNTITGGWGTSEADTQRQGARTAKFMNETLPHYREKLEIVANTYTSMVGRFLAMLEAHKDINLRFLKDRINFNTHYKSDETKKKEASRRQQQDPLGAPPSVADSSSAPAAVSSSGLVANAKPSSSLATAGVPPRSAASATTISLGTAANARQTRGVTSSTTLTGTTLTTSTTSASLSTNPLSGPASGLAQPPTSTFTLPPTSAFPQPSAAGYAQPSSLGFTQPSSLAFTQPSSLGFSPPSTTGLPSLGQFRYPADLPSLATPPRAHGSEPS